jgi:hypothetical protein
MHIFPPMSKDTDINLGDSDDLIYSNNETAIFNQINSYDWLKANGHPGALFDNLCDKLG